MVLMPPHLVVAGTVRGVVDPEAPEAVAGRPQHVTHRQTLQLREWRSLVGLPIFREFVGGLQGRYEQIVLVLEMVVDRPGADPGGFADQSHRDAVNTMLGD